MNEIVSCSLKLLLDAFSDSYMIGYIVHIKRKYRINGKVKWKSYIRYQPGLLDTFPGGKRLLLKLIKSKERI